MTSSKFFAEFIFTKYDSWRHLVQFLSLGQKFGREFFHIFLVFQTSKDRFSAKMMKEWNFIHLVDLSFDKRFVAQLVSILRTTLWHVRMKCENVILLKFRVLFSKCTFLKLQHFFLLVFIQSIFSVVVRIYKIEVFDEAFFPLNSHCYDD